MIHKKGIILNYGVSSDARCYTSFSRTTIKQTKKIIDIISIILNKNTDSAETVFKSLHTD